VRPFNGVLTPRKVRKLAEPAKDTWWLRPEFQQDRGAFWREIRIRRQQRESEGHSFAYPYQEGP
jgi:hypothetical protein